MATPYTLDNALRHFGKTRSDLLSWNVYEDSVVLIVVPGPKLIYDARAAAEARKPGAPVGLESESESPEVEPGEVKATEAAVEMARQTGIDLSTIEGTGSGGKITLKDVERAVQARSAEG